MEHLEFFRRNPGAQIEDFYTHALILRVKVQDHPWVNLLKRHNGRFVYPKIESIVLPINFSLIAPPQTTVKGDGLNSLGLYGGIHDYP